MGRHKSIWKIIYIDKLEGSKIPLIATKIDIRVRYAKKYIPRLVAAAIEQMDKIMAESSESST